MAVHFKKLLFLSVTALLLAQMTGCAVVEIKQVGYKDAKHVPEDIQTAPMAFEDLQLFMKAGSDVGAISDFGWDEPVWFVIPANRFMLNAGIDRNELELVFTQVMEGQGYDVVDTISQIFPEEYENELLRAEYRVAGQIIDAKMDADYETPDNRGSFIYANEGIRGRLYLKIKWAVYDALRRKVIYETVSEGTGGSKTPDVEGMTLMVNAAFDVAAHNLAADEGFYNLMVHGEKPKESISSSKKSERPLKYSFDEQVEIEPRALSRSSFQSVIDNARKVAVLVQGGAGHGSGFFITKDGHILTNQHVVGNAQRVRIVTADQEQELIAQVLRTSPERDAALLKLEEIPADMTIRVLPIRTEWPAVSEDIYAVGAPKSIRLQDTISKGIVSAHRPEYKMVGRQIDFIQGDVPIHGGNSGGPLLDAHGNIVGISVMGLFMHAGKRSSDLNLFIPIEDALDVLDIKFDEKRGRSKPALRPQPLHTQTDF